MNFQLFWKMGVRPIYIQSFLSHLLWVLDFLEEPKFSTSNTNNQSKAVGNMQIGLTNRASISENASLYASSYNVSEKAGSVSVTVQRTGNLNQYAIVLCRTEQGSASSSSRLSSQPGQQDYMEYAGQVGVWGASVYWTVGRLQPGFWHACRPQWLLLTALFHHLPFASILLYKVFLCSLPYVPYVLSSLIFNKV